MVTARSAVCGDGLSGRGEIHLFAQFFADLEERKFLRLHHNFLAGFRVAPFVGAILFDHEAAEASDLDIFSLSQSIFSP